MSTRPCPRGKAAAHPGAGRAALVRSFPFASLIVGVAVFLPAWAAPAAAQQPSTDPLAEIRAELDALRNRYEEKLGELDRRVTELETENAALREGTAVAPPPSASTATPLEPATLPPPAVAGPSGDATQTSNYFNPAISVIGNFLGVAGRSGDGDEALPTAEFRESEISFQAVIDPFARADLFLAFGEEGVEVEEGYVTLTALPANLLAKVGRMRADFGKVNTLHLHNLPWPDQPLPVVNLLGSDEGWIATGVSLAALVPLPADTFSEATVQVFGGESELFDPIDREDLAYNLHYRVFRDLSDATNLDLGISWATGANGLDVGTDTELWGFDATYRWNPLRTNNRGAIFRGEIYNSRRDQVDTIQDAMGWFASGEYQFAKRWSSGLRYEWSERADDETLHDRGEALLLSFSPSEFSKLRAEYRRRHFAEDTTADELLLQLQFAIGAHSAHPF
jgi:hypothetical protein